MEIYHENIRKYVDEEIRLKKLLNRISLLRLLVFAASLAIVLSLFSIDLITPVFFIVPVSVGVFIWIIKHYNRIFYLKKHTSFLKNINEAEIKRAECDLEDFDPGEKFINPDHPYTSDLDVFGQHSIFQLINRTSTESGELMLSEWLAEPAVKSEIYERQEAIREISPDLDWRQDFQASGMQYQNKKSDYQKLLEWVVAPQTIKKRGLNIIVAIILSIMSLGGLYLAVINLITPYWYIFLLPFIVVMFINSIILKKLKTTADEIVRTSEQNINTLKGYRTLIKIIEKGSFKSGKLRGLQAMLKNSKYSAFREIKQLSDLLEFGQQRGINSIRIPIKGNPFYFLLNSFILLDIYLISGIEKWKQRNREDMKSWAEVVSEFEVINSFAGFNFSNPSYIFPEITDRYNFVRFEYLGHPLIHSDIRVCNDFSSRGKGDIAMITGSNMGGKSTFLRSVGVNLVLALSGGPCCAKSGELSNLELFTSLRTQDNLKKGISSFYAELERIEKMLILMEKKQNVFFLLDEMFKGTNSEDRHKGGFSLINQISKLKTSGIIATHDIELAKLSGDKNLVKNYSFNSEIKGDEMHFSYKLMSGICNDFNASELMRRSGINIISDKSIKIK